MKTSEKSAIPVLSVCIGNSCRSLMAEAVARQNAADIIEPTSAGLVPLGHLERMTTRIRVANAYGAEGLHSKPIRSDAWQSAQIIVNMSRRPRETIFEGLLEGGRLACRRSLWRGSGDLSENPG